MVSTDILQSLYLLYSQATSEKDTNIIETHSFRIHARSILTIETKYFLFYDRFQGHPSFSNTNRITAFYVFNYSSFDEVTVIG